MDSALRTETHGDPPGPAFARDGGRDGQRNFLYRTSLAIVVTLVLLTYGSLLPCHFDPARAAGCWQAGVSPLALHMPTVEDFAVNVLVYMPLGILLALRLIPRSSMTWLAGSLRIVAIGSFFSLTLECLQTFVPARVPSWTDVATNTFGTACGVAIGLTWMRGRCDDRRFCHGSSMLHPFQQYALLLTVGLLSWSLAPFDLVKTTAELVGSFLQADWSLPPAEEVSSKAALLTASIDELDGLLWFAVLGYLSTLAVRARGASVFAAMFWAIQHGTILAVLVECLQLFTRSHVFEPLIVPPRAFSAALGALCAARFAGTDSMQSDARNPAGRAPAGLLFLLLLYQPYRLVVAALEPTAAESADSIPWTLLPFLALWREPAVDAAMQVAGMIIAYGTFALLLGWVLERTGACHPWLKSAAAAAVLASYTEALQAFVPGRCPDTTTVLLALLAAFLAATAARRMRRIVPVAA